MRDGKGLSEEAYDVSVRKGKEREKEGKGENLRKREVISLCLPNRRHADAVDAEA